MLGGILENVTEACHGALEEDERFTFFQQKFYDIIKEYSQEDLFALDEAFNACVAQAQKIAYLQGMRDLVRLHIDLKGDLTDILGKCEQ